MKKLFLGFFALLLTVSVFAQRDMSAEEATDELVELYDLDAKQVDQMLVIQKRKVRNLEEIEQIKTSDKKKYRHKFRAIQQSTDASIRRMLSETQMKVYRKKRMEWRKKRSAKISTLKDSGMSLEQIEDKLLEEGF